MYLLAKRHSMTDEQQKKVLLRLPLGVADFISALSRKRLRSLNNQIIALIKLGIANEKEENQALIDADQIIAQSRSEGS